MNTRIDMIIPGLDESHEETIVELIQSEVGRIEQKLSLFISNSMLSEINRSAYHNPFKIDDELLYILKNCMNYYEITEGIFDITMRPLMNFWSDHEISEENIKKALDIRTRLGSDKIILNKKNKTIQFSTPELMIDFGAFGRGYALQRIKLLLRDQKVENAFVSFGGTSMMGIGNHPYGKGWKTGVSDFFDFNASLYTFELHDQVLSVSGNNRTAQMRKETIKGHIIDPKSAIPVQGMSAVASLSLSAIDSEALSITLFIADEQKRNNIIRKFPSTLSLYVEFEDLNRIHLKEIK